MALFDAVLMSTGSIQWKMIAFRLAHLLWKHCYDTQNCCQIYTNLRHSITSKVAGIKIAAMCIMLTVKIIQKSLSLKWRLYGKGGLWYWLVQPIHQNQCKALTPWHRLAAELITNLLIVYDSMIAPNFKAYYCPDLSWKFTRGDHAGVSQGEVLLPGSCWQQWTCLPPLVPKQSLEKIWRKWFQLCLIAGCFDNLLRYMSTMKAWHNKICM